MSGEYFIQVLEGEKVDVDATFVRISTDPRHRQIVLVGSKRIPQRRFRKWALGFARTSEILDSIRASYSPKALFEPAAVDGDTLADWVLQQVALEATVH